MDISPAEVAIMDRELTSVREFISGAVGDMAKHAKTECTESLCPFLTFYEFAERMPHGQLCTYFAVALTMILNERERGNLPSVDINGGDAGE